MPTARITTAALKKVSPATIATGLPSRPRNPSGPASPSSRRNATPDDHGRQRERHQQQRPQRPAPREVQPIERVRRRETQRQRRAVPAAADHSVNHTTRCTRGRASTSSTPPGSKVPSTKNPRATIALTGSTKKTTSTASGHEPRARPSVATGEAAAQRDVTSVHVVSHSSRLVVISAGSTV